MDGIEDTVDVVSFLVSNARFVSFEVVLLLFGVKDKVSFSTPLMLCSILTGAVQRIITCFLMCCSWICSSIGCCFVDFVHRFSFGLLSSVICSLVES